MYSPELPLILRLKNSSMHVDEDPIRFVSSDILGEEQVPVAERAQVPVVRTAPGASVVWVGGIRLDDRFKCTAASRVLVKLVIRRVDAV